MERKVLGVKGPYVEKKGNTLKHLLGLCTFQEFGMTFGQVGKRWAQPESKDKKLELKKRQDRFLSHG